MYCAMLCRFLLFDVLFLVFLAGLVIYLYWYDNCMQHVAILSKKGNLLRKIIDGKKTVESRWYRFKRVPWGSISKGDVVFFKESGNPVSVKAEVDDVIFYSDLDDAKIRWILEEYGCNLGVDISYFENVRGKRYCILIFLKDVARIRPFEIDKSGFGVMSAWICVDDVSEIRKG